MGHELMAEHLAARARTEEAYQRARPEIGRLQATAAESIDRMLLDAALMAYDFESFIRGYSMRMERGAVPLATWLSDLESTWKFYKVENFSEISDRAKTRWPAIANYMNSVMLLEDFFRKYIESASSRN